MTTLDNISASKYDIKYYSGDEFDLSITVTDEDGNAVGLLGKTLKFQVKRSKTDTAVNAIIDISTASEISIGGASNNIVTFSGIYDLQGGKYYYDLENTTDSDTIMYGVFIVVYDVTR